MRTLSSRSGFTLTELLVVIAIIGVLTAISVPAVMVARSTAQKAACANNLKDLGTAITTYHSDKEKYPPSFYTRTYVDPADPANNVDVTLNWAISILEYMDQAPLADRIKDDPRIMMATPPAGVTNEVFKFDKFICPMDNIDNYVGAMSYAANMGVYDDADTSHAGHTLFRDPMGRGAGIFYDRTTHRGTTGLMVTMSADDVHDGLSQTILVAERSNPESGVTARFPRQMGQPFWNGTNESAVGLVWRSQDSVNDEFALTAAQKGGREYIGFGESVNAVTEGEPYEGAGGLNGIGAEQIDFARPASYHNGAVNVLFCDGSVQAVQAGIDYDIYARMMTSDSRELTPGVRGTGILKDSDY